MGSPPTDRARAAPARRLRERLSGTPRLVLAVVLLAVGTLVALTATTPAAAGPVVVATHRVVAGGLLGAGDLVVVQRAVADRPDGALTAVAPALGQRAGATLDRGDVVTGSRLAPKGFATDLAPGRAIATVAVASSRAGLVTVGDTVRLVVAAGALARADVLAPDDAAATVSPVTLADEARVVAVWPQSPDEGSAILVVDVDVGSASSLAVLPADLLVGAVIVTA